MASLIFAVGDSTLADRLASASRQQPDIEFVVSDSDPRDVAQVASVREVDGLCFLPQSPDRMLGLRRAMASGKSRSGTARLAVIVDRADAGLVYHVLGYGIDDVIELSIDDAALAGALIEFATGEKRVCRHHLMANVDPVDPIMRGTIECVDENDLKIVRLVSVGYTDREIGEILHFSHQVIRNRISHILIRSNLRNRTQLAARYTFESIERGAIDRP